MINLSATWLGHVAQSSRLDQPGPTKPNPKNHKTPKTDGTPRSLVLTTSCFFGATDPLGTVFLIRPTSELAQLINSPGVEISSSPDTELNLA